MEEVNGEPSCDLRVRVAADGCLGENGVVMSPISSSITSAFTN